MTTSDGVAFRHPPIPMVDVHPRIDIDTISILSSQSDSVPHLSSYIESDDEGKGLVAGSSTRLHEAIAQVSSLNSSQQQSSTSQKPWSVYVNKTNNSNNGKHRHHHHHHHNESSSDTSDSDNDQSSSSASDDNRDNDDDDDEDSSEQDFGDDPWTINTAQREYYTKQFQGLQSDTNKVISGHIAKEFFERSRLPTSELSKIWTLSDVNHDGALSLAEFCTAMHLVVLRVNRIELPDELPAQLQPYTPLIDLSDNITVLTQTTTTTSQDPSENWAVFNDDKYDIAVNVNTHPEEDLNSPNHIPKHFTYVPPVADNHRIVAPVPVRLSPPPSNMPTNGSNSAVSIVTKPAPPPPPPRVVPARTMSIDIPPQPILPPRTLVNETPQRNVPLAIVPGTNPTSTNTTPYAYNRVRPQIASTPQQADANALLGQIRDLLQPDHLQELASIISAPSITTTENLHAALNQTKLRNSVLKSQLKYWEDQLTDLIDKRISLELQNKLQHNQQQQQQ